MNASIRPCLWFDGRAEEAARLYVSLLPDSRIDAVTPYPVDTPGGRQGEVMTVDFTLAGRPHMALNGGPYFSFTPAVSMLVECEGQEEVDRLWAALGEGGAEQQCGWLTDRYGLSWQIVPAEFGRLMQSGAPAGVRRMSEAMLTMKKLDMARLKAAYEEGAPA